MTKEEKEIVRSRVERAVRFMREKNPFLTNAVIGELTDISENSLERILSGTAQANPKWLHRFCNVFGLEESYFTDTERVDDDPALGEDTEHIIEELEKQRAVREKAGERLREIRTGLGLSYRKFAGKCGIEYSTVYRAEIGQVNVSPQMADKIEKALGNADVLSS